ncbi:MAG: hypothetical protein ICV87_00955 [Gemmatimonadetes bacterium]|nr:hypothetical protein [Gemmatimonadota bacterium]
MPTIKKLTPILYVERIEPALPFWERLGYARTAEVPHGDALGFVILEKDGVEIMYQTRDSVLTDLPAVADGLTMRGSLLFIEVDDLAAVERAVEGAEVVVPRRRTPYGAEEVFVREPAGNVVGFAQFGG